MIKKVEDWTFTEHQSYAKGMFDGMFMGFMLTLNIVGFGYLVYQVFN